MGAWRPRRDVGLLRVCVRAVARRILETVCPRCYLLQQLAREADAVIGGTLYSDSLSGPTGQASTYLKMFRHNANAITRAFSS